MLEGFAVYCRILCYRLFKLLQGKVLLGTKYICLPQIQMLTPQMAAFGGIADGNYVRLHGQSPEPTGLIF